jgi:phage FluMu protein gp41
MATMTIMLRHGLKVGDAVHYEAELREIDAGDILDAIAESEKMVMTPNGTFQMVRSPILATVAVIRRRLVRIGSFEGPFTTEILRALLASDFALLAGASDKMDSALVEEAVRTVGEPGVPPLPI